VRPAEGQRSHPREGVLVLARPVAFTAGTPLADVNPYAVPHEAALVYEHAGTR
jgi:hypothetical protein